MSPSGTAGGRGRWAALLVLCTGVLMIVLDTTIVNVALPSIQRDLGFSQPGLAWVVNAYLIPFGGLLLLAGRLGDLLGRLRLYVAGLALFTLASLLCGLAGSQALLVGARFVQGIGGAFTSAVVLGIVVTLFPQPREQARAIGVYSFFQAAGGSLGLLLGGALTQAIDWHWIFYVNVPIGVVTALLAARLPVREQPLGLRRGADALGAALLVAALMLGVATIVGVEAHGWTSARTLGGGLVVLSLLSAFARREHRTAAPLVAPRLLHSRALVSANLVLALLVAGLFAMQFLVPLHLRRVLGYDPLQIGLAFLPLPLVIAVLSLGVTGRLIARFGAGTTVLPGLALIAVGLALLARLPAAGGYAAHVLPAMVVLGAGGGLALPSLMSLAMQAVPAADAGLASGVANTTIQVGGALGLSALVTLASSTVGLLAGYHAAFAAAAGLAAMAFVLALVLLRPRRGRALSACPAPG